MSSKDDTLEIRRDEELAAALTEADRVFIKIPWHSAV